MSTPHRFRRSRLALAVSIALSAGAFGLPAHADTFTVTSDADDGPGSLRAAVDEANTNPDIDIIEFDAGLIGSTIETDPAQGNIQVTENLVVQGPGSNNLTIMPSDDFGNAVLFNHSGADVSVTGLTIDGGGASGSRFAIGGGSSATSFTASDVVIENFGNASSPLYLFNDDISISNSVIRNNSGGDSGGMALFGDVISISNVQVTGNSNSSSGAGGIRLGADTSAEIVDSVIAGNQTSGRGGGIAIGAAPGVVTITASTIADNEAADGGGGIYFEPEGVDGPSTLRIVDSTISGNSTANSNIGSNQTLGSGGGLLVANEFNMDYTLEIVQSTISGNTSAAVGGAIYIGTRTAGTDIDIDFSTLTDNTAEFSGGILVANTGGADIDVSNTVIAGNTGNQDGADAGDVASNTDGDNINISFSYFGAVGGNITDDGNSITNGGDPGLGALGTAPYGNMKTEVHIPMEGSNLIDIGDPALTAGNGGTPVNDQTGIERIVNGIIDIGAVEFNPDPPTSGGGGGGGAIGGGLLGLLAGLLFRRRRLRE